MARISENGVHYGRQVGSLVVKTVLYTTINGSALAFTNRCAVRTTGIFQSSQVTTQLTGRIKTGRYQRPKVTERQ